MILAGATAYPFFCFVDMNGENSRQITFLYSWQRSCARKYRISEEDLQVMLTALNIRCAICGEIAALVIEHDHDHKHGLIKKCDLRSL
jgi:hypothetical protein